MGLLRGRTTVLFWQARWSIIPIRRHFTRHEKETRSQYPLGWSEIEAPAQQPALGCRCQDQPMGNAPFQKQRARRRERRLPVHALLRRGGFEIGSVCGARSYANSARYPRPGRHGCPGKQIRRHLSQERSPHSLERITAARLLPFGTSRAYPGASQLWRTTELRETDKSWLLAPQYSPSGCRSRIDGKDVVCR